MGKSNLRSMLQRKSSGRLFKKIPTVLILAFIYYSLIFRVFNWPPSSSSWLPKITVTQIVAARATDFLENCKINTNMFSNHRNEPPSSSSTSSNEELDRKHVRTSTVMWFQLVDNQGRNFHGRGAMRVELDTQAKSCLYQLFIFIIRMEEVRTLLGDRLFADQLSAYATRSAFDHRVNGADPGAPGGPLRPDYLLSDLDISLHGHTFDHRLWILVPDSDENSSRALHLTPSPPLRSVYFCLARSCGTCLRLPEYVRQVVSLSAREASIAQLTQSVCANFSSYIPAAIRKEHLQVYSNKFAFESQNESLMPSMLLPDTMATGGSEQNTLFVVFPDAMNAALDSILSETKVDLTNCWNENSCLLLDLGHRITPYDPANDGTVKIMLALSGGGKTRTLLELLFCRWGFYFTAANPDGVGSNDLTWLMVYAVSLPENIAFVQTYIELLVCVRLHIMDWFKSRHSGNPDSWLYAQLFPSEVFGVDLFKVCLRAALDCKVTTQFDRTDLLVAIDEVQVFLAAEQHRWPHFTRPRPFLSPLLRTLNGFTNQLIISGTGVNYLHVHDITSSSTLKQCKFSYETVDNFPFLHFDEVLKYSEMVLEKRLRFTKYPFTRTMRNVARQIAANTLCQGRPRLAASVLDNFFKNLENHGVESSLEKAFEYLEKYSLGNFPQKVVRFLEEGDEADQKNFGKRTFHDLVLEMFVHSLISGRGKFVFNASETKERNQAAEMIRRGVGFMESKRYIVLSEPIVLTFLSTFYSAETYICSLLRMLPSFETNQLVGYWFEYLVAVALVKKFGGHAVKRSNMSLADYLNGDEENAFVMPDEMCGPDIVFKVGKDVWFVQVRCVKAFYRQYRLDCAETVDPKLFYTIRKAGPRRGQVLTGYRKRREKILRAIADQSLNIHRMVVASTRVTIPGNIKDITWISPTTEEGKSFFAPIHDDPMYIWDLMDEQCYGQNDFEKPNTEDPDELIGHQNTH